MTSEISESAAPVLEARHISKAFAGVQALSDVSLTLQAGEVHALMGENGAGKSTLVKVLAGIHRADAGRIVRNGQPVTIGSPHQALQEGIAMIHQELMPIPDLTVAENVLLGQEPAHRLFGWIDRRRLHERAERLLARLDARIGLQRKMRELSVAQMQTVEIARALGRDARIVIMDEPTAAISDREVDSLCEVIRRLKARGVAIVYITHKMDEVYRVADRISVLRDGIHVGAYPAARLDRQRLISLMVGREWAAHAPPVLPSAARGEVALAVHGLGRDGVFQDIDFQVRRGEVLGLAGLMGAGRTEVVSALFGLQPADRGEIRVHGTRVGIRCPDQAIRLGIGMVTEDRTGWGLVPSMSVRHNVTLAALKKYCRGPLIRHRVEAGVAEERLRALAIKTSGARQAVNQLSGGNQQKVVIARTLLAEPSIVILDEPTRGIDVGAKTEIYGLIARLAQQGKAILLVSSEMPELLSLSDRVLVMREGRITAELDPRQTSQEEVLKYAMPV